MDTIRADEHYNSSAAGVFGRFESPSVDAKQQRQSAKTPHEEPEARLQRSRLHTFPVAIEHTNRGRTLLRSLAEGYVDLRELGVITSIKKSPLHPNPAMRLDVVTSGLLIQIANSLPGLVMYLLEQCVSPSDMTALTWWYAHAITSPFWSDFDRMVEDDPRWPKIHYIMSQLYQAKEPDNYGSFRQHKVLVVVKDPWVRLVYVVGIVKLLQSSPTPGGLTVDAFRVSVVRPNDPPSLLPMQVEALNTGNQHLQVLVAGPEIATAGVHAINANTVIVEGPLACQYDYMRLEDLLTRGDGSSDVIDAYLLYDTDKKADLQVMDVLNRDGSFGMGR